MNELTVNERTIDILRWMPFGFMMITLLIISGYWKIEKTRELPLPSYQEYRGSPQAGQQAKPPPSKMEGKLAPAFALPLLGGGTLNLDEYRGKVVFLNFWATWCPPCEEEMPSMQKLYEHFKGTDFVMLTVSIDEKKELVEPFMKRLGLNFPVAFDPKNEVGEQYGLTGVPETFLIGPTGIIMHHMVGPGDWFNESIVGAFSTLLERLEKAKAEANSAN